MPIAPETVAILQALADPVRLSILERLSGAPAGVTELARHLPITRQGTAKHLAILRAAGLVGVDSAGRDAQYRVATEPVRNVAETLTAAADLWSGQLSLLKDAAESADESDGVG